MKELLTQLDPKVQILSCLVFGLSSSMVARRRGRSPYKWFFAGAIGGLIGLMITFFMKPLPKITPPVYTPPSLSEWYYLNPDKSHEGPFTLEELMTAYRKEAITSRTYIWKEDTPKWVRFGTSEIYPGPL